MKVIEKFKDKETKRIYEVGDKYEGSPKRIAFLQTVGKLEKSQTDKITHVGGGWYEVNGERVQGKAEAERIAGEG